MTQEKFFHKNLAAGRWHTMTLAEQLGNTGSEVERAVRHKEKNNQESSTLAFYRALELLDLTIADKRWITRLKELCRTREVLCDFFAGKNEFKTTSGFLIKYFYQFGYLARTQSGFKQ